MLIRNINELMPLSQLVVIIGNILIYINLTLYIFNYITLPDILTTVDTVAESGSGKSSLIKTFIQHLLPGVFNYNLYFCK
jgi:hypothetical protein